MRAKSCLESVDVLIEAPENLDALAEHCRYEHIPVRGCDPPDISNHSEFLVHAADVEGLCQGIDKELVKSGSLNRP